jgi:hypothetical protein
LRIAECGLRIGPTAILITALALCNLGAPLSAHAQHAERVYRIGFLSEAPPPTPLAPYSSLEAFRQAMRALGYVEGQNLLIDTRADEVIQ